MTVMINNPDGTQSEAYTKEEHEKALKKAREEAAEEARTAATKTAEEQYNKRIEELQNQNAPQTDELTQLRADLEAKQARIDELEQSKEGDGGEGDKNKEAQIQRLKEEREAERKAFETKLNTMEEKINSVVSDKKAEAIEAHINSIPDARLQQLGGREEYRKRVEMEYEGFAGDVNTADEVQARIQKAATLAGGVGESGPGALHNANQNGRGVQDHFNHNQQTERSETSKKMDQALGITPEDAEKYGPGGEKYRSGSSAN